MANSADLYKLVKVSGIFLFVQMVLVAGPLGGYFLGNYLERRFSWPAWTTFVLITAGFLVSLKESIRIIRLAIKIGK